MDAPREGAPAERRLVVDRFEGDLAVVEVDGGEVVDLPRWLLPPGAREGDVVRLRTTAAEEGRREVTLLLDADATRAARDDAARRLERLRARDPGGDVEL